MRIGIISDTHDRLVRTQRAVAILREAGAEALIHCGDFTSPAIVTTCAVLPLYYVFGNNDSDMCPHLRLAGDEAGATCLDWGGVVDLGGKRLGVTHGHMTTDMRRVLGEAPDYLFSGHSHLVDDHMEGTVRRINPGALHRALNFTVAILDLGTGELEFLDVPR
jgi:putative phosphoesterase